MPSRCWVPAVAPGRPPRAQGPPGRARARGWRRAHLVDIFREPMHLLRPRERHGAGPAAPLTGAGAQAAATAVAAATANAKRAEPNQERGTPPASAFIADQAPPPEAPPTACPPPPHPDHRPRPGAPAQSLLLGNRQAPPPRRLSHWRVPEPGEGGGEGAGFMGRNQAAIGPWRRRSRGRRRRRGAGWGPGNSLGGPGDSRAGGGEAGAGWRRKKGAEGGARRPRTRVGEALSKVVSRGGRVLGAAPPNAVGVGRPRWVGEGPWALGRLPHGLGEGW